MIEANDEYKSYDIGQLIDVTEKYGLVDAKQRIYNHHRVCQALRCFRGNQLYFD